MYPGYPTGSVPPPYGVGPPAGTFPIPSSYDAPPPPGFVVQQQLPQAGYATQEAYPPVAYPPQCGYPVSGYPPPHSSYPAGPQLDFPQPTFPYPQDYGAQPGYTAAAQPPYNGEYCIHLQAGTEFTLVAVGFFIVQLFKFNLDCSSKHIYIAFMCMSTRPHDSKR